MKKMRTIFWMLLLASFTMAGCAGGTGPSQSWPSITVDPERETVYLASGLHLYAINAASGVERWRFPAKADNKVSFYAPPALTPDGQLIASGYDHVVYSLEPATGQVRWSYAQATNRYVAGPAIADDMIFAAASDHILYALDFQGQEKWRFTAGHALWGTPAVNGELVYLPALDHRIYALDMTTGQQAWVTEDTKGAIVSTPTLGPDGRLYFGTFASQLVALERENGKLLWQIPTSGWVWASPLLVDDTLYFGDLSGSFYAVNAADGTVIWKIQPDTAAKRAIAGTPLLLNDTLYFASESGALFAVDPATGNPRWNKVLGGRMYAGPLAIGETIVAALYDADSLLVALDASGNIKWSYVPPKQ